MRGQVSRGSVGDYQADELAGVEGLSWRLSSRGAIRFRAAQLAIIKQMSGQVSRGPVAIIKHMNGQGSRGSAGDYQADERAGVVRLSWRSSSR